MKKLTQKNKKKIELYGLVTILLLLAVVVGINRIHVSDFNPVNGDFQNYNPIRRFLDGQTPFKDFAVYLGTGHLFLLSFFQFLVGNTFTRSLFVSNMTTFLCFELFVFAISFFILKDKRKSLYLTLLFSLLNILRPNILNCLNQKFLEAFECGISPGTSARMIRVAIAPILLLFIYLVLKWLNRSKIPFIQKHLPLLQKCLVATIAGSAILWSNDGGVAAYISISFVYFLLLMKEYKKNIIKILQYTVLYIGISMISFFVLVTIITRGNPLTWFQFNLGVSSYQAWYFGVAYEKVNVNLVKFDLELLNVIMFITAIIYIVKLFQEKNRQNTQNYAMLCVFVIFALLSSYLYQFLSGGFSKDVLYLTLLVIVSSYIYDYVIHTKKTAFYHNFKIVIAILGIATIISNVNGQLIRYKYRNVDTVYIEELDGYFSRLGNSIRYAIDRVGNDSVFSTYATALDTATKQFQPSGIDYIIHVLGDEQRERYLEAFRSSNSKYVADVDSYNVYSNWIRNANWFFFKELYQNYRPSFVTEYNTFYEQMSTAEKKHSVYDVHDSKLEIQKISNSTYAIHLDTKNRNQNGVVNLTISYKTKFIRNVFQSLDIRRYVYALDVNQQNLRNLPYNDFGLPSDSSEYSIPLTVIDGKGSVIITSFPKDNTELELLSVEATDLYDVMFRYAYPSFSMKPDLENGIIYVDNTTENQVILNNVQKIKNGDTSLNVIKTEQDESYILLYVEKSERGLSTFEYPNFFEILK